ncbi:MAG TPA: hypothetical protein VN600_10480 [Gemmatimonadaceae bacterium]|nr:hypothetical protein [Gemmatimonadaceae bacterium]
MARASSAVRRKRPSAAFTTAAALTLALSLALSIGVLRAPAMAAQVPVTAGTPPLDTSAAPRGFHVSAGGLHPGQFLYQTVLERDASTTPLGSRTVSTTLMTYGGAPVWLMLETRTGAGIPATDSLIADSASLQPIHWNSTVGQARLGIEFRGDTAFGATTAPAGRRSIVAAMPAGTIVSPAMLETVLRLVPLQPGWHDSTTTLSVLLGATALLPTQLSVIGEDRVQVPAGSFDCWVVSVRAASAHGLYWVTKSDPIVVRSAVDVPSLGGAEMVSALTSIVR